MIVLISLQIYFTHLDIKTAGFASHKFLPEFGGFMTGPSDALFEAIQKYVELKEQGQAPSIEEYILPYPDGLRPHLRTALHNLPDDIAAQKAWLKIRNTLYKSNHEPNDSSS